VGETGDNRNDRRGVGGREEDTINNVAEIIVIIDESPEEMRPLNKRRGDKQ
jgi:hypothetical protein